MKDKAQSYTHPTFTAAAPPPSHDITNPNPLHPDCFLYTWTHKQVHILQAEHTTRLPTPTQFDPVLAAPMSATPLQTACL